MNKIVVISPVPTHPISAGNRSCILSYTKMLEELGNLVFFFWISPHYHYESEYEEMINYWKDRFIFCRMSLINIILTKLYDITVFKFAKYCSLDSRYKFAFGINRKIKSIQKKYNFDTVIINYVFLSRFFKCFKNKKKILYTHDVFTNKGLTSKAKWVTLKPDEEMNGLNRADIIFSIQEHESIFYRFLSYKKILTVYGYFPVRSTPFVGMCEQNHYKILYLSGNNEHNIEAIIWFYMEVFSILKVLYPNIRLIVGGLICEKIKSVIKSDKNVELQGVVYDVYQFYSQADIFVNPTFSGTGLKIKTFEALSYGKILVAHPHSLIGLFDKEQIPVLVASSKDEYIDQFKQLFASVDRWNDMKQHSIDYMLSFQTFVKQQFRYALNVE
jgi:glycosyltransferase involved in cell wall biosynthesis